MSIAAGTVHRAKAFSLGQVPAWLWLGIGVYALAVINGRALLNDSDTYWQITIGQWILDHNALPRVDFYSFTKAGEPWVSSSWLSQVLLAASYNLAGWTGPIVLAAACIAATFALLTWILGQRLPALFAIVVTLVALLVPVQHLLARPHVFVLPVMLAWAYGLLSASERGRAPSFWLLPLIALWANLHGGFIFGLVLVGGLALDALWNADRAERKTLALRWAAFGVAALAACCVTPYGWGSVLAARKILDLGELLHLIYEWMPADFSRLSMFEMAILALIGGALYGGVKLSPPRIALVLGLLHMALAHNRNIEIFALLLPIVVMTPVASQFGWQPARFAQMGLPAAVTAVLLVLARLLELGAFGQCRICAAGAAVAGRSRRCAEGAQSQTGAQRPAVRRLPDLAADARVHRRARRALWRSVRNGLLPRIAAQGRQPVPRYSQDLGDRCRAADARDTGGRIARQYRRLAAYLFRRKRRPARSHAELTADSSGGHNGAANWRPRRLSGRRCT